jgi:hypothetical protein
VLLSSRWVAEQNKARKSSDFREGGLRGLAEGYAQMERAFRGDGALSGFGRTNPTGKQQ